MSTDLKSFIFFNNLTQQEVADYLGVAKSYMSQIATGRVKLSDKLRTKLVENDRGWKTEYLTDSTWDKLDESKCEEVNTNNIELVRVLAENKQLKERVAFLEDLIRTMNVSSAK